MPMIAMTREMGSLGRDVATRLAAAHEPQGRLPRDDRPDGQQDARAQEPRRALPRGRSRALERLTAEKTSVSIFTADETFRFLRNGETGVLRGWGATHLLRSVPHVVRVRVCAPIGLRIDRMMERLGTDDRTTVESEILHERGGAHRDRAPALRHRLARPGELRPRALDRAPERRRVRRRGREHDERMPRFQETPESLRIVENLSLEWAVRAALKRDPRTANVSIGVECERGARAPARDRRHAGGGRRRRGGGRGRRGRGRRRERAEIVQAAATRSWRQG